nr:protein FAR1-related sequence 5-like [Tanacetum cinerariifolium]
MYKVYSEKGRFNNRKLGIKRYTGKVTHWYVLCNSAGKVRSKFDINTLKEADADDEEKDGNTKRKRKTVSKVTNYRDAHMIVDKMINQQLHVPEFSFEYHVLHEELVSMFRADDTMKCNYAVFGNVVSFDATFRTNKYDFVFVPFTGIDHNKKCVTFGAALLSDETEDSYCWMLKDFLKVHQKQPTLALTDQDAALRNVVVIMFPDSKHRLCNVETCIIRQTDKRSKTVIEAMNSRNIHTSSLDKRSSPYTLLEKRHIYGPCIEETDRLAADVHATIKDCIGLLRSSTGKLTQFLTTVKEMKK